MVITCPAPHDFELKAEYLDRIESHPAVRAHLPTPAKRRLAAERRWAQCKARCQVSISTHKGEVLLFD